MKTLSLLALASFITLGTCLTADATTSPAPPKVAGLSGHVLSFGKADPAVRDFQKWFSQYRKKRVPLRETRPQNGRRGGGGGGRGGRGGWDDRQASPAELEMRNLVNALVKSGSKEAIECLLDAAVIRFSDETKELEKDALYKPWRVRYVAKAALEGLKDAQSRKILLGILKDNNEKLSRRVATAEALRVHRDSHEVQDALINLLKDRREPLVTRAALSLEQLAPLDALDALYKTVKSKSQGVRIAAFSAIDRILNKNLNNMSDEAKQKAMGTVLAGLEDDSWRVRLSASQLAIRLRSVASIPRLIAALEQEQPNKRKDFNGRVRASLHRTLRTLTGAFFPMNAAAKWEAWWEENESRFKLPDVPEKQAVGATAASFFNIPVDSTKVVFVIDRSRSMLEEIGEGNTGANRRQSKWNRAVRELEGAVRQLSPEARFNIIFFANDVTEWGKSLRDASVANKDKAIAWINNQSPDGGTNLYGGVSNALELSRNGKDDLDKFDADTLFILSDGEPTVGQLIRPNEILQKIRSTNELAKIKVNTISFGWNPSPFMQRLARENGGEYKHVGTGGRRGRRR